MKRLVTCFLTSIMFCNIGFADMINITLYKDCNYDDVHICCKEDRSLSVIPSLAYDADKGSLSITSNGFIYNMHIIITDDKGNVVVDEYVCLSSTPLNLNIGYDNIYKIEIEYGQNNLYGYINN